MLFSFFRRFIIIIIGSNLWVFQNEVQSIFFALGFVMIHHYFTLLFIQISMIDKSYISSNKSILNLFTIKPCFIVISDRDIQPVN